MQKKHLVLELRYLLNRHEVSYDTHGGNAIQSKMFLYGMKVDAVPTPTRKGYTFTGWTRETPGKNASSANSSTPDTSTNATLLDKMPDYDVHFVAHWKPASEKAQYTVNIWVQKADLPKPDDPTNIENYDFIGQVHKQGKTDTTIGEQDLSLDQNDITTLQWPDANLRGTITNQDDFSKYFMEDDTTKSLTTKMNEGTEPEYFGSQEMRERTKIRPDGTTIVNKVFNRRTYELIFANADIEKMAQLINCLIGLSTLPSQKMVKNITIPIRTSSIKLPIALDKPFITQVVFQQMSKQNDTQRKTTTRPHLV